MNEMQILLNLDGNTYRLFRFLELRAGDRKVIHAITRQEIQETLGLGYTKTYEALKTLQEKHLIEYKGAKQFCRIL